MTQLDGFGLGSCMGLSLRCQQGLLSSECLTGVGGSASKMAPLSHSWQINVGCWKETLVPLYIELSECPHQVVAGFLQENKAEATMSSLPQLQRSHSVISVIFLWSHGSAPFSVGGDYTGLSGYHLRGCPPVVSLIRRKSLSYSRHLFHQNPLSLYPSLLGIPVGLCL